jgi:hypothetical protein
MHADLLSLCWIHRNTPLLVDPGTFSYRWQPPKDVHEHENWREYFAGPLAHNGIVIDAEDPLGPIVGDFRPGSTTTSVRHTIVIDGDNLALVEAEIVSPPRYANVARGVIHVRGEYFLAYSSRGKNAASNQLVFPLQLDHRARIVTENGHVLAIAGGEDTEVTIIYSDELLVSGRHLGRKNPIRGWVAPRYGELQPATQLEFRPAGDGDTAAFALGVNSEAPIRRVTSCRVGQSTVAFQLDGSVFSDYILVNAGSPDTPVSAFGIEFTGRLVWLRVGGPANAEVRAFDVVSCKAPVFGIDLNFGTRQREIREIGRNR